MARPTIIRQLAGFSAGVGIAPSSPSPPRHAAPAARIRTPIAAFAEAARGMDRASMLAMNYSATDGAPKSGSRFDRGPTSPKKFVPSSKTPFDTDISAESRKPGFHYLHGNASTCLIA